MLTKLIAGKENPKPNSVDSNYDLKLKIGEETKQGSSKKWLEEEGELSSKSKKKKNLKKNAEIKAEKWKVGTAQKQGKGLDRRL